MFFKKRIVNSSSCIKIFLNNENLRNTIIWLWGNLGKKKYYIPNEINITKTFLFINFLTFKYFYFKYCVLFSILLRNSIYGLIRGFKSYLTVKGLGFKLLIEDKHTIKFYIGYSHSINYKIPNNVKIDILPKKLKALRVFTNDWQYTKEIVYRLKKFRKPNNYKFQGIFGYKETYKLKNNKKKI